MNVADKTALTVGGVTLLDRVLAAADHAQSVVAVGPERPVARPVRWVQDEPADGGPAAAVNAGFAHVTADVVVLLAADLPLVSAAHLDRLAAAVSADGAVYVDADGSEQWLCSAWRTAALRGAALTVDGSLRRALATLSYARLSDVAASVDCDTPDDLRRAEEMVT
jgi:molybdopterin-guanine dinucleotide biosynthesis protein A